MPTLSGTGKVYINGKHHAIMLLVLNGEFKTANINGNLKLNDGYLIYIYNNFLYN